MQDWQAFGGKTGPSMLARAAERVVLLWGWRRLAVAFAAGAVAVLALPPFDFFPAMFLSFPLLVWLLDGAGGDPLRGPVGRMLPAFATGWAFGFGYFVAGLWWLGAALLVDAGAFAWLLPFAVLGLPAFLAIFFGLGAAGARLLWSDGPGRTAALALGLTLAEWLRGFLLTGFPWNTIGYGAMPVPLAMQSAAPIGLLGVTALALVGFSAPALFTTRRGAATGGAALVVLATAHLGYGAFVLSGDSGARAEDAETATVRIVQPSIPQSMKWDDAERRRILQTYLDLTTRPATGERPDIIVWPETAIPYIVNRSPEVLSLIADSLQDGQLLAVGAVRAGETGPNGPRYYNSITVIGSDGVIRDAADKVHLVPFGEYVPFADILSRFGLTAIAEMPAAFTAAPARSLLDIAGLSALPLICYEAIFPLHPEDLPARPDFILNVTNDAWYGATPGPYQHFAQARLRAVEAGLPMIRAANNGISAIADARGRIIGGLELDAVGVLDAELPQAGVSYWDSNTRRYNQWLILAGLFLFAVAGRTKFSR